MNLKTFFFHGIVFIIFIFSFLRCTEDESYVSNPSQYLSFSRDTVTFDTVFTSVGSSTKWVKVYNSNTKGVRIRSVHLASGGTTGFRINVDGQSGTAFENVEIDHKDSIYLFVEVTIDPQDTNSPFLLEDSIIFDLETGKRQAVHLEAFGQDAIILKSPLYKNDTQLSAEKPYIVFDSLIVDKDAQLTLQSGTRLYFHDAAYLGVHGTLVCEGTQEEPVLLRGDRLDRMFSYLPYDRLSAQWGGVMFYQESTGNVIRHADIHSGRYGVTCLGGMTEGVKLSMENSIVHNVTSDALSSDNCRIYAANCQFSNAKGCCVRLIGGYGEFVHCTLAQFYPYDQHEEALWFSNTKDLALEGAVFHNCYITGNGKDDISGLREDEGKAFNYLFDHCVVNTVFAETDTLFKECVVDTLSDRSKNFSLVDFDNFKFDFRLDSLSVARKAASASYLSSYPEDLLGNTRTEGNVDAGCYQSVFSK